MSSTLVPDPAHLIKPVVLGATGRLGGMVRAIWGSDAAIWQSRAPRSGFAQASPDRIAPLLEGAPAVLCLWGATPASGGDMADNATLAKQALDAAAAARAGPVLLASSAAVYGRRSTGLNEAAAPTPVAPYGVAKAEMEQMALNHPHPSCILRIGNVAGADAILGGWRPGMTLDAKSGRTPARSYIGPVQLADVLASLMRQTNLPPVLNVAAPGAVEMGHLLDAADLGWAPRPAHDGVIWNVTLDTARLAAIYPFDRKVSSAAQIVKDWRTWRAML